MRDTKTKNIKQTVTFKATPHEIYEILMDSRTHSRVTGAKASVSRTIGAKFSAYDDYISGTNINIVPDRKIVQSWRASDWPEGHYSEVVFQLEEAKGGTRLTFTQNNVPEDQYEGIKKGWNDFYWIPMKEFLGRKGKQSE